MFKQLLQLARIVRQYNESVDTVWRTAYQEAFRRRARELFGGTPLNSDQGSQIIIFPSESNKRRLNKLFPSPFNFVPANGEQMMVPGCLTSRRYFINGTVYTSFLSANRSYDTRGIWELLAHEIVTCLDCSRDMCAGAQLHETNSLDGSTYVFQYETDGRIYQRGMFCRTCASLLNNRQQTFGRDMPWPEELRSNREYGVYSQTNMRLANLCDFHGQWVLLWGREALLSQLGRPARVVAYQAAPTWRRVPAYAVGNYTVDPMAYSNVSFMLGPQERAHDRTLFMGVELEVQIKPGGDIGEAVAAIYESMVGKIAIGSDASLRDGFEIKSVPATLSAHRLMWDPFFAGPAKLVRSFNATCSCGMHVHMNQSAFTPIQLGRMIEFLNAPKNLEFIDRVAGRQIAKTGFCTPLNGLGRTAALQTRGVKLAIRRHNLGDRIGSAFNENVMQKYRPLRLETGKPTYELRIFRGNVSKDGFMRNLDFTAALFEFCLVSHVTTSAAFLDWFKRPEQLSRYKAMAAFFKGRLIPAEKIKGTRVYVEEGTADLLQVKAKSLDEIIANN